MMTRLLFISFIAISVLAPAALADATIYLVRHAEKAVDGTKDPNLTPEGKARAAWIATFLKDKNLRKIYSTDYKRTRQTAAPIAAIAGLPVELYNPRTLEAFAEQLRLEQGAVLVSGHSNTTPVLVGHLIGEPLGELNEDQYDRIYIVTIGDDGKASYRITYSEPRTP